ncbi:MAG: leucine-rich repeat protein, partial [Ruminococcus sp.]
INIGESAFEGCTKLAAAEISNGVKQIDSRAFYNCALSSINIPSSITDIGEYAFGFMASTVAYMPVANFKISGQRGTAAEKYALSYGFPFIALGESTYTISTTTTTTTTAVTTTDNTDTSTVTDITTSENTEDTSVTYVTETTSVTSITTTTITSESTEMQGDKGDVDGDGRSDARDAYIVLKYYAMTRAGLEPVFNDITPVDSEERAFYSADMDSNNVINLDDALIILKLYAMKTAGITQ